MLTFRWKRGERGLSLLAEREMDPKRLRPAQRPSVQFIAVSLHGHFSVLSLRRIPLNAGGDYASIARNSDTWEVRGVESGRTMVLKQREKKRRREMGGGSKYGKAMKGYYCELTMKTFLCQPCISKV